MVVEVGDYFFDLFGIESREKGKGIDRSVIFFYFYYDMYYFCFFFEILECLYLLLDNEDGMLWYVRFEKDEEEC